MKRAAAAVPHRQYVAFRVGESELALDVHRVHEVLRTLPISAVPSAPAFLEGLIDVRGALVPVIDLRRRFEVAEPVDDLETRIVLVGLGAETLAVLVDRVTEVLRVPETAVGPPPAYVRETVEVALDAVVRLGDRIVLVLDLDGLLSSEERIELSDLERLRDRLAAEPTAESQPEPAAGTGAAPDGAPNGAPDGSGDPAEGPAA